MVCLERASGCSAALSYRPHQNAAAGCRNVPQQLNNDPSLHQRRTLVLTRSLEASSAGSNNDRTQSSSNSRNGDDKPRKSTGLLGKLHEWQQDTRALRDKLQSLGLAGVVAYGLFNTAYYTVAFLFVWYTVAATPSTSGLGLQAAARKAAEVFALVWAGSQVTKLLRAAGALAFAPVVEKGLSLAVEKLRLKNKQQAFVLVVAACAAAAAAVFGVVVAVHA